MLTKALLVNLLEAWDTPACTSEEVLHLNTIAVSTLRVAGTTANAPIISTTTPTIIILTTSLVQTLRVVLRNLNSISESLDCTAMTTSTDRYRIRLRDQ
jgi:hypothetical protein